MRHSLTPLALCLSGLTLGPVAAPGGEPVEAYAHTVTAEPGLVAYWPLASDLQDAKGGHHGQAGGGAPTFVPGPGGGQALALAKGQFVSMGATPDLDLAQTTVELWFRLDAAPGGYGCNPCLLAKRSNQPDHTATRFSLHVWGDHSCLAIWNGGGVARFSLPEGQLTQGQWYYLAVTSDGQGSRLYLDGVQCQAADTAVPFDRAKTGLPLVLGASSPQGSEQLPAALAQVAVYATVLGPDDIARHADAMGWRERRETLLVAEKERAERARRQLEERLAREAEAKARRLADPALLALGASRVYQGEDLTGISLPVGGIAAGPIQMDGRAMRPVWQIFNNYQHVAVADSFFAVCVSASDGKPILRALQTEAVGPFAAMNALTFRGEYPFGWYEFSDAELPVRLSLEVFSPLTPLNARDSAMPAAVFAVTAENPGAAPVKLTVLATQQNAVGNSLEGPAAKDRKFVGYGGNQNRVLRQAAATVLHLTGEPGASPACGDMCLAALTPEAQAGASWEDVAKLAEAVASGSLGGPDSAGPSPDGETLNGALAVPLSLGPGQKATARFVLTWHFPNADQPWVGGRGNMYANWWPDALAVAQELCRRLDELTLATRTYHDTLYASNLPHWLLDRVSSQVAILASRTCFWSQDGYFGGWEGCNPRGGCCAGNCGHVWHYAQAHARLFPEIARRMREEVLRYQRPDGAIFFRQPGGGIAADAQAGEVLEAYREHLLSPDGRWLQAHWPRIQRAVEYLVRAWDPDEDGIMSGAQHNTLDADSSGCSSWLGSLYVAALDAGARMAGVQGDSAYSERYRRLRDTAAKAQDEKLWNGEYYVQVPASPPLRDYGNGCHIDQVLGQWWADQLDLDPVYPSDRVRAAMAALVRYNFRPRLAGVAQAPRKFVADEDAALQMIQWPPGVDRPPNHMLYADEAMTGFEYAAAATMIQAGLLTEGCLVAKAVADRYDGRLRRELSAGDCTAWGYSGNPFGDDECGKFYARAMSSWSLLLACQGFVYDGPAGLIGFRPRWSPADHVSFFTAAEGYGLFRQNRTGGQQTARIELRHGSLAVTALVLAVPPNVKVTAAGVTVRGQALSATAQAEPSRITLRLASPVAIQAGEAIDVSLETR